MSVLRIVLAASFAACLISTAAAAQTAADQSTAPAAVPATPDQATLPPPAAPEAASATQAGVSASVTVGDSGVVNTTVANAPVPDTPDNRAKYGAPMSHAGRATQPAGN
jgi:hypothetical protein